MSQRAYIGEKSSREEQALSRAIAAELTVDDWQQWRTHFLTRKRRLIAEADLDTVDAMFPPEILNGDGTVAGYAEIFPWVAPLEFTLERDAWLADDQYCVASDCKCREAILSFAKFATAGKVTRRPARARVSITFDYDNRRMSVLNHGLFAPEANALLAALLVDHPELDGTLRERHRQLRHLASRFVPARTVAGKRTFLPMPDDPARDDFAPKPVVRAATPGRNEPCPCGSGRKYKKCCGS